MDTALKQEELITQPSRLSDQDLEHVVGGKGKDGDGGRPRYHTFGGYGARGTYSGWNPHVGYDTPLR